MFPNQFRPVPNEPMKTIQASNHVQDAYRLVRENFFTNTKVFVSCHVTLSLWNPLNAQNFCIIS